MPACRKAPACVRNPSAANDGGDGDRDLVGLAADDRLRGDDRGGAANRTARADQHRGLAVEAEPPDADVDGLCLGGGAAPPDGANAV